MAGHSVFSVENPLVDLIAHVDESFLAARGKRLQVRSNFIGNISFSCSPVTTNKYKINHSVLHKMTAGIISNQGMWHACLAKLPGSQPGPLVPGPGLIHPYMYRYACFMCQIYG